MALKQKKKNISLYSLEDKEGTNGRDPSYSIRNNSKYKIVICSYNQYLLMNFVFPKCNSHSILLGVSLYFAQYFTLCICKLKFSLCVILFTK